MLLLFRILAMLVVVPGTYYFIYWVPFSLIQFRGYHWISSLVSLLCAVGVGWYVWKRLGLVPKGLVSSTIVGAVVLGSVGFCAGFFGPMILTPEANQGPLLGIFIIGPAGFLCGGIGGLIYWLIKGRKETRA